MDGGHYASENVAEILDELNSPWTDVLHTVDHKGSRRSEAEQRQAFNRVVHLVELWLIAVEARFDNVVGGIDSASAQTLQKESELLEEDLDAHHDLVDSVIQTADRLLAANHFDAANIANKREQVLRRFESLKVRKCALFCEVCGDLSYVSFFLKFRLRPWCVRPIATLGRPTTTLGDFFTVVSKCCTDHKDTSIVTAGRVQGRGLAQTPSPCF